MTRYTYKVIPAPAKGRKAPGVKGAEARFAYGLEEAINEMAAQGWEYLRADILPSEERQGLTSTATIYRSVLVFRREARGTGSEERPVPSLTARRGPPTEEDLAFTRRAPVVDAVAHDVVEEDVETPAEDPAVLEAEDRAANDDSPVRGDDTPDEPRDDAPAETDDPDTDEDQDETTEAPADDEEDSPRR